MTVSELIEELKKLPQDATVYDFRSPCYSDGYKEEINAVELRDIKEVVLY